MKKMIFFIAIVILLIPACDDQEVKEEDLAQFQKLEWMQGIWEGEQGDAVLYESWRSKNFRIMEGISYTTVDTKRVYSQDMRIEQSNNKIYFIIKKDSNQDEVKLELAEVSDSTAEFINPGEDFPQKIIYSRHKKEKMSVALLGDDEAENKTELLYKKTEDFSQESPGASNL